MNEAAHQQTARALQIIADFRAWHDSWYDHLDHPQLAAAWMWQRFETDNYAFSTAQTRIALARQIDNGEEDADAFRWN